MDLTGLLRLFEAAAILKRIPRAGWLLRGVPQVESVADHSYGTVLVALALVEVVNAEGAVRVDRERVLVMAALHDLAEARLTDLPAPATRLIPKGVKEQAEAAAMRELLAGLPTADEVLAVWQEYEDEVSNEAKLVHDADRLEMMVQALRYEQAGSRGLDEFWETGDRAVWHFAVSAALYQELKAARPA